MAKLLDLDQTVHALCTQYPDLPELLQEAGFSDITKPGMLNTVGRFMTIPKGAAMKRIDLKQVRQLFEAHGYEVTGGGLT